jgi:hypothetical protein
MWNSTYIISSPIQKKFEKLNDQSNSLGMKIYIQDIYISIVRKKVHPLFLPSLFSLHPFNNKVNLEESRSV